MTKTTKTVSSVKSTIIKGCGVQGCCPTVEYKGSKVFVRDDFNNVVNMTLKQWKDLILAVVKHESKK